MYCFEICFGHAPFRICYPVCFPEYLPWPWPPRIGPDPPEFSPLIGLTIDGGHPDWLRDVYALAMAVRGAEMATGEVGKMLGDAVTRATAHVQMRMPEGVTLAQHAHQAAYAKA